MPSRYGAGLLHRLGERRAGEQKSEEGNQFTHRFVGHGVPQNGEVKAGLTTNEATDSSMFFVQDDS
jgi:hypothetical protein